MTLRAKQLEWEVANGGDSLWGSLLGKRWAEVEREVGGARWVVLLAFPYQETDHPPFDTPEEAKAEAQRQLNVFVNAIAEVVE